MRRVVPLGDTVEEAETGQILTLKELWALPAEAAVPRAQDLEWPAPPAVYQGEPPSTYSIAAWVLATVGLVNCWLLNVVALGLALQAKRDGYRNSDFLVKYCLITLGINLIFVAVLILSRWSQLDQASMNLFRSGRN